MRRLIHAYFVVLFVYFAPTVNAQPVPCDKQDGKGMADCVEAAHPERLAAGVTLIVRQANLAFLRDRLIETARCATVDAGLNCKRGNCANLSLDFIAVKQGGVTFGVDFAGHSDDLTRRLDLGWYQHGPPTYGYPTYKAYGPVSCIIQPPTPPPPVQDPGVFIKIEQLEKLNKELSEALGILRTELAEARAQIGQVRTHIGNLDAVVLPQIESRVLKLEQHPAPAGYVCRAQFGLRCTVTPEYNP